MHVCFLAREVVDRRQHERACWSTSAENRYNGSKGSGCTFLIQLKQRRTFTFYAASSSG